MMRAWLRVGLIVGVCIVAWVSIVGAQNPIAVILPERELRVGETVTISARIACPRRICSGYQIALRYDPAIIRVDSSAPGTYFGANVRAPSRGNQIDPITGTVRLAAAGMPAPAGDDRLFTLTITGAAAGESMLRFEQLTITGADAARADALGVDGRLVVRDAPTPTEMPTNTPSPTATPTATEPLKPTSTPSPTLTATATETPTLTPRPSDTASPTIAFTPTPNLPVLATLAPQATHTVTFTPSATFTPSRTPTPQPCVAQAVRQGVTVHVGPDPNRVARATMVTGRSYVVRGQAAGADGVTWYNIVWENTNEPDRFWVSSDDVRVTGDCDAASAVATSGFVQVRPTAAAATITGTRSITPTITGTPPTATTGATLNPNGIDCSGLVLYEPVGAFTPSNPNQFSWSPVFGAIYYRLTISNGGSWIMYQTQANSPGAQVNLGGAPSDPRWTGRISWTVQAIRSGSGEGEVRCESQAAVAISSIP
jgi:hypothetical protein